MKRFDELRKLLDLEQIELNIFRGQNERGQVGRLFGGQVLSQALMAAGRTVERLPAHSLHGYFLRPGDPKAPVVYTVDRLRDGKSFVTRNVVAYQHGQAILNLSASFHQAERGFEHQDAMPPAPEPESVPTWAQRMKQVPHLAQWAERVERGAPPIDFRFVELPMYLGGQPGPDPNLIWMRAGGELPADDTLLHQGFVTYATDMSLIDAIVRHHGPREPGREPGMAASLDHAVWFHRPFRADEWLLYAQDSPCSFGARGFARGAIYTRAGVRVASVAQEGLVRPPLTAKRG